MSGLVVDASVVMAWLFDDEEEPRADSVLELLEEDGALAPHLWHLETRNTLLVAERRSRVSAAGIVAVPPVAAAKVALYLAMREQGITRGDLARRLGLSETAVRRLVNPDHRSHIGQLQKALRAVGRTLVVEDRAA